MVLIEDRFNGPPGSGNGGYSAGAVALALGPGDGIPEVTLRSPPRLGVEFTVEPTEGGIAVLDGTVLVAEGRWIETTIDAPGAVSYDAAASASAASTLHGAHPYPECFVCGPQRQSGDGLRIIPGRVEGSDLVASTWTPDPSVADADGVVRPEVVWAALDCPSWFGFEFAQAYEGRPLLGRLTAEIIQLPHAGDRLVSVGWSGASDGRKVPGGAALYSDDGTLLALSRATWLIVP